MTTTPEQAAELRGLLKTLDDDNWGNAKLGWCARRALPAILADHAELVRVREAVVRAVQLIDQSQRLRCFDPEDALEQCEDLLRAALAPIPEPRADAGGGEG